MNYIVNESAILNCGFNLDVYDILNAIIQANENLMALPASLYRSIDYKTTSAMIGCFLCESIVNNTNGAIVNPIEKGHPDIIPSYGINATEEELRHFPVGLEVKCTVGAVDESVPKASPRIDALSGLTWQAHHREVNELLGITYDYFIFNSEYKPIITAAFYSDRLTSCDWGRISGTDGRNTKVCSMLVSGKEKMGNGWLTVLDNKKYIYAYTKILNFSIR